MNKCPFRTFSSFIATNLTFFYCSLCCLIVCVSLCNFLETTQRCLSLKIK